MLLRENAANRVHVVDDLSSNPIPHEKLIRELGDRFLQTERLSWDVCSVAEWFERNQGNFDCEEIYHLASAVGPAGVLQHAGKMVKSIVDDTYRLMELAIRENARLLD